MIGSTAIVPNNGLLIPLFIGSLQVSSWSSVRWWKLYVGCVTSSYWRCSCCPSLLWLACNCTMASWLIAVLSSRILIYRISSGENITRMTVSNKPPHIRPVTMDTPLILFWEYSYRCFRQYNFRRHRNQLSAIKLSSANNNKIALFQVTWMNPVRVH